MVAALGDSLTPLLLLSVLAVMSGWGALQGTVTDRFTGQPVAGATVATADGKTLLIAARDAKQLLYFDIASNKVTKSVAAPEVVTGVALSPDGTKAYITCGSAKGVVAVIDVAGAKVASTIPVGHTAVGPSVSADGKWLYVCNRFDNDVSVFDLATGKAVGMDSIMEVKRFAVSVSGDEIRVDL